jgi:hypothetical protein
MFRNRVVFVRFSFRRDGNQVVTGKFLLDRTIYSENDFENQRTMIARYNNTATRAAAPSPLPPSACTVLSSSSSSTTAMETPVSPFTTTSDVLRQLNAALEGLGIGAGDEEKKASSRNDGDDNSENDVDNDDAASVDRTRISPPATNKKPGFELQRKFEDGSARRATEAERKANDFENKLQQVARHLSSLPDRRARWQFIDGQIEYGNRLYSNRQFEEAMDVYLTCLAGVDLDRRTDSSSKSVVLLVRILHNLALAALQLGWYGKCLRFASMGIEALRLAEGTGKAAGTREDGGIGRGTSTDAGNDCSNDDDNNDDSNDATIVVDELDVARGESQDMSSSVGENDEVQAARRAYAAKLFHVRAKAGRLKGHYRDAQKDLAEASRWIRDKCSGAGGNDSTARDAQRAAVRKEQRLLQHAMQQGRTNRLRQQSAMQQILATTNTTATTTTASSFSDDASRTTAVASLYDDVMDDDEGRSAPGTGSKRRRYSRLRAPSYYAGTLRGGARTDDRPKSAPQRQGGGGGKGGCCQRVVAAVKSWLDHQVGVFESRANKDC